MRFALDHQAFCRQPFGGVSRYFSRLAMEIERTDKHKIRIFAPWHISRYLDPLAPSLVDGRRLSHYPFQTKFLFKFANSVAARARIRSWRPDVVHETYFQAKGMAPKGTPSVLTVYDMIHERFPEEFWPWDPTRLNKKRAVERADHVICISDSTRRDLLDIFAVSPEKVSVVYLAHDRFAVSETEDPAGPVEGTFLLYVGHRGGYKNFASLLKAFGSSNEIAMNVKLVCFGGGNFSQNELNFIRRYKVQGRVEQLSGNDQFLGHLYRSAIALVYPSLYEGFGLPPLEAMANDCPVLCSNTSSLPEVVGNAGLLFDPTDVDAIRYALETVLFTTSCRKQLIQQGRERLKHFSWKKCAEETVRIYEQVC